MPRAGTQRRRGAATVSVLLGALLALLMCSGATAAGSAPGPAGPAATDAGAVTATAAVAPLAVDGLPAAVGDQQAPGCGKSPGDDSGTGPGAPARGSSSYELLHVLYDTRAAAGPWGSHGVRPAVTPDPGPPPLDPPSPIDLSVLRV
ncbi:MAG TPA: hypothetical protein VFH94_08480 [Streptomyces sp.]|nr:hypothetical protein [Streptomyces sp.]